jgi:hypothetical protein
VIGIRAAGLVVCVLVLGTAPAGCVAPAPTTSAYEAKATQAAKAAVSAARTALIAEDAWAHTRMLSPYLETTVVNSEQALGGVRTSFDSVQPPATDSADALREALDPLLEQADSALSDLRIAVRRDDPGAMASAADDLSAVADRLAAFTQEHGG